MRATYKMIRQIERLGGREVSRKRARRAAELVEAHTPIGALLATLSTDPFRPTMLEAAKGCHEEEEALAWLTLAAAGPGKTWGLLADRAASLLDLGVLEALADEEDRRGACAARAESARSEEEWGAWLLVSRLSRRQLERAIDAHPHRRGATRRREGRINPQIAEQLSALGLV
ncbi:MAG TPA: hypothetical protein VHA80_07060 [Solirubrobacterales bacterium]|nr:hypothetical protein [Solirubrobacterales bacterium]